MALTPSPIRLGLLAASPVYYQVPLYRGLARDPRLEFTAIFCSSEGVRPHDAGYGQPITWDVDLLGGYHSVFLARAPKNPIDGSFFALRDFDVVQRVLEERYDVLWLHGYNSLTNQLAALTQVARGGAILFREEQTLMHPRPLWKTMVKGIWLRTLFARSYVLYIGTQNKKWFQSFGVSDSRMFFAPYSADNDRLQPESCRSREARAALREAFNLPAEGKPVILFVGRLIPKKQPYFLLDAYGEVRRELPCALMIVGSGELESSLRAKVARDQIPDVYFTGFLNRTQISKAYLAADIFTLPSREHETWGLVVNEAMSFSLPVVVTDKVGCADDLVRHGENGFIVSSGNPSELAARLGELIRSSGLRKKFGTASRQIVGRWTYDDALSGALAAIRTAVGPERWRAANDANRAAVGG